MNLDLLRPKNETEDILLSKSKNCETLFERTHTKPQQKLEFQLTQPRVYFSFKPCINIGFNCKCMIGLTTLEICTFLFILTEEIKKFEPYTDLYDEFSVTEKKVSMRRFLVFQVLHPNFSKMKQ